MQPPRAATVAKVVAATIGARILWRTGKLVYNVLTSVPPNSDLHHNCLPPKNWKHATVSEAATRAYIQQNYPELVDLVDRGNLIVLQPAAMLSELLQKQHQNKQQQQQSSPGAFLAANEAALAAEAPSFSEADIAELLSSPQLQHCMANPVPQLMVLVGTVHVAKQSADDVTRVIQVIVSNCIMLEKFSTHVGPGLPVLFCSY
jgi:hypothetical protein